MNRHTNELRQISSVFESNFRIQILTILLSGPQTYSEIKKICNMTDGNMSTHTKKLLEEHFIEYHKDFVNNKPVTTYYITETGKEAFKNYVKLLENILRTER